MFCEEETSLEWHSQLPAYPLLSLLLSEESWFLFEKEQSLMVQPFYPFYWGNILMFTWRKYAFFLTPPCEFSGAGTPSCRWGLGEVVVAQNHWELFRVSLTQLIWLKELCHILNNKGNIFIFIHMALLFFNWVLTWVQESGLLLIDSLKAPECT